jgi:SWI/SNF-related matrix-associated actin-dependent regulator 1 of chromatin subfamily A
VCPASVKINWKKEIRFYTDRPVLIVEGRKWGSTYDFYIINYDILKNYHTTDKKEENDDLKLITKENFELAIVDEAHYASNATANRTKLINDILENIPKIWLLTGTPMTNRPINYYNLLKLVDSSVALNWQHYVKRYCKGFRMKVNGRTIWNTSGHSNLDELRERTKSVMLRRLKSEISGLPEKTISPIYLELKSTYYNEELEDFMRISEENKHRTTLNINTQEEEPDPENVVAILGRLMKVRQVLAFEKIPYTCEYIDKCLELDKKVLVFTNFTMPLDILHEKYPKNSVIYDGRMSATKREEAKEKFQNDPKIKILIGNIIAAGIGINLTSAEVVIMNDLSFVPSHHSQGEDRAYRQGQMKDVLVYYPIFENTIEMIIYNILQRKKDVIDQSIGDGEYSESFGKELLKELF